jgi:hypothetical protein
MCEGVFLPSFKTKSGVINVLLQFGKIPLGIEIVNIYGECHIFRMSKGKNNSFKKCESCLIYDFYVRKDYLKKLRYGLLYLPNLMTPRCSN